MQFRISFASLVTGFVIVCMTIGVISMMVMDLNTAADDDQMHSENLRIRSELDSMQVETRELQRQIELLQAYSLHIDISAAELETQIPDKRADKKTKQQTSKKTSKKTKKEKNNLQKSADNTSSKPSIYIEVKEEPPKNGDGKDGIFIDVSSDENSSKKK